MEYDPSPMGSSESNKAYAVDRLEIYSDNMVIAVLYVISQAGKSLEIDLSYVGENIMIGVLISAILYEIDLITHLRKFEGDSPYHRACSSNMIEIDAIGKSYESNFAHYLLTPSRRAMSQSSYNSVQL